MNRSHTTHGGILVKLVGSDEVNGEDDLDVVLLCLLDEGADLLRSSLVEEGVTDLEPCVEKISQILLAT